MSTILARILQSTGLAANIGLLQPREWGVSSDTERPAVGTTVGGAKLLTTEEVINITTTAPAAIPLLRRSLTLVFIDTTTAGGHVNLDISAGAQVAGYRCRVFVNGPDAYQAIVAYGGSSAEYVVNGYSQEFVWSGAAWMKTQVSNADRFLLGQILDSIGEYTIDAKTPIVKLWDSDHDLADTAYPLIAPFLRNQVAQVWNGSAYVDTHTPTIAGSVATGSGTAWNNLLASLLEDEVVHGSYANWRSVNIASVDYAITIVNTVAHTLTVSGTPPSGVQDLLYFPHRIAGLPSSARVFKDSGRALMSIDGVTLCASNRRRNHLQGHRHKFNPGGTDTIRNGLVDGGSNASGYHTTGLVEDPETDGTNGTPRTGNDTEPNSTPVYRAMWAGVLL